MDSTKTISYWQETAKKQEIVNKSLTHSDLFLPKLETEAIVSYIEEGDEVVEIGCGACDNSIPIIKKCKSYLGIDVVDTFIKLARERLAIEQLTNAVLLCHDGYEYVVNNSIQQSALVTQRFLINLKKELQLPFFKELLIHRGRIRRIILCEGFLEELMNLNILREAIGLKPIPVAYYNNFLEADFLNRLQELGYKIVTEINFNLYFYLTRLFNNDTFSKPESGFAQAAFSLQHHGWIEFQKNVSYSKVVVLEFPGS